MICATSAPDGTFLTVNASVSGAVVYLDNWAIGDLAEGDLSRRKRFIEAMRGMDLLFSVTNAAELSGPLGRSAELVRTFLDEIGPRWVPVELSPIDVINREMAGTFNQGSPCVSESFTKSFVVHVMRSYGPGSGRVIDLSDQFFKLGSVLDWMNPQRESIRSSFQDWDNLMSSKLSAIAHRGKQDPPWLLARFPWVPFHPVRRAFFVYQNLLRVLIDEGGTIRSGDGMDFCHAVMASAYATFATLDKRWKRRAESLPKPNQLARIYCSSELDQMVTDMELWLAHRAAS
jgi:hypothetical protein